MVNMQGSELIRYSHFVDVSLSYSIALSGYFEVEIDKLIVRIDDCRVKCPVIGYAS